MRLPEPIQVLDLFPQERIALLQLLSELTEEQWALPTACEGWSVKDVALHILGGDLGNISVRRDGYGEHPAPGEDLVTFINRFNNQWVDASRRLSPRVVIDLLAFSGPPLFDLFSTLDLYVPGGGVSWAGLDAAPVWLDVAREYTERWLHQQHIRNAVGKPGLTDRHFMGPVLAAFVFALPRTFQDTKAPEGTAVQLHIEGEAGGDWALVKEEEGWVLYEGTANQANTRISIDQQDVWRLFTKGLTPEQAAAAVSVEGDKQLGSRVLQAVAIIA